MRERLPPWFTQKIPEPVAMRSMERLLREKHLHTVCEGALCPNIGNCFGKKTATFMILGNVCTRSCTFCAVEKGMPEPLDGKEPNHVAEAVLALGLRYVVITSVTRDDLADGGALHFAGVIRKLREIDPEIIVEVLIPDFKGSEKSLDEVIDANPHVINHNIETVQRLYERVRPQADYERSMKVLHRVKQMNRQIVTKSGLMLGLGESGAEVLGVMTDLRKEGCDLLTMGQYLQPSPRHHPIIRFVPPDEFAQYEKTGKKMGFAGVASAPLARSSFKAAELYMSAKAVALPGGLE